MLAEADRELARRDERLPGLPVILDAEAVLNRLREAHPGVSLASARLRYLRYKPGTNCVGALEVLAGGQRVLVHAKAWNAADYAKLAKHTEMAPGDGPIRGVFLPREAMSLRVFPDDAKLTSLSAWMHPTQRTDLVQRRPALGVLAEAADFTVLAYKPERRLVARLNRADGSPAGVLKVHAATAFESAYAGARGLVSGPGYRVAHLLGKSRTHHGLILEWMEGEVLASRLHGDGGVLADVARVGMALAGFHRQTRPALEAVDPAALALELPGHARVLTHLRPVCGPRIDRLVGRLVRALAAAPNDRAVLHGDFHAAQVLWGEPVAFLDLDQARLGPGWMDLAHFVAHLELDVVAGRLTAATAGAVTGALTEGYAASVPAFDPAELPPLVAVALFQQAVQCFRSRLPDWPQRLEAVLDRCEALAGAHGRRGSATSSGEDARPTATGAGVDPAMPFLAWALNRDWMERRLLQLEGATRELAGHRLLAAELVRHKPGRRCLIEYRFGAADGGEFSWLGKARARAGRDAAADTARALRQAGLGNDSAVSVPEPLGRVPELNLELQRRVPGRSVFEGLDSADGPLVAARCAAAVTRLHRSGVTVARSHTVADELAILEGRLDRAAVAEPALADRVRQVGRGCRALAATLAAVEPTLIHRDFYPDQVLVDGERLWLLDLDLCAMGDPAVDHGNFLAHLVEWSVRHHGHPDALRACGEAYASAALAALGVDAAPRLDAWVTLSLARHLQLSLELPGRRAATPGILSACEERLAGVGRAVLTVS